jgi:hypothetical protein
MELKNFFAQDLSGNVIASPTVYLYAPSTTTPATGLQDKNGAALTNPFTGSTSGFIQFAAPDGDYDLRVTGAGRDFTMRVRFLDASPGPVQVLREDLAASTGAASIGADDSKSGEAFGAAQQAFDLLPWGRIQAERPVSLIDAIPPSERAAILNGTSTLDIAPYLNVALAAAVSVGNTGVTAGYVGYVIPTVEIPSGVYVCGEVNLPSRVMLRCAGRAVFKSPTGTASVPAGKFSDDVVTDGEIEGITFLYYDKVLRWPTNNIDMSFHTLRRVTVAYCNELIDQVSFALSRSTTTLLDRVKVSYGVPRLGTFYADKTTIQSSWLTHSTNSYLIWADSRLTVRDCIVVPTTSTPSTSRALIWWQATDSTRSALLDDVRFGGESGQSPIIVVGDVNTSNANNAYRNQGVTIRRCELSSNTNYDPDSIGAVNANVVLRPTVVGGSRAIQFVKFEDCYAGPDKSGGVVQYYGTGDVTTLLTTDFVIDLDAASLRSFVRGTNRPTSDALSRYVAYSQVNSKVSGIRGETGRILPVNTATTGQKKISFKVDLSHPGTRHTPVAFLVTLNGQGTSSSDNNAYACSSVYIVTIAGFFSGSLQSKIAFTKLHGSAMGNSEAANADIISAHFGTGDTGTATRALSGTPGANDGVDVTIAFGTGVGGLAACYVRPLFDFSLLT